MQTFDQFVAGWLVLVFVRCAPHAHDDVRKGTMYGHIVELGLNIKQTKT